MRILHVIATLSAGGAESFVANLSAAMAGEGNDVQLFLLAGVRGERGRVLLEQLYASGVSVLGVKERRPATVFNFLHLAYVIRMWRPDVVQANLPSAEIACLAARFLTCDLGRLYVRRLANPRSPSRKLRRFLFIARGRAYDATIACSEAVALATSDAVGGSCKHRLAMIRNGVQLAESLPSELSRREARIRFGVPMSAYVVAHLGGFRRDLGPVGGLELGAKAHDVVLRAFTAAFGGMSETHLLLGGDGILRADAEKLALQLGIGHQVSFLGTLPEPWRMLEAADVFFFPSRTEGMPNVLPEAASCGLPIVASDIPPIRDLASGASWLLRPVDDVLGFAEALRTVRQEKEEFDCAAANAAEDVRRRFSMQACARGYIDLFQKLVKN